MLTALTILLVLFSASLSSGVRHYTPNSPNPLLEPWRWQKFTELSGKGLECMIGDQRGNLWFGTAYGVYQYDGLDWSHFPVTPETLGSTIYYLAFTKDGVLYAGSDRAILRLQDGAWHRVFPSSDQIRCPVSGFSPAGDDGMWATTPFGILHFSPLAVTAYADKGNAAWIQSHSPDIKVHYVPTELVPSLDWPDDNEIGAKIEQGIVYNVAEQGPASEAGLLPGDRITSGLAQLTSTRTRQAEFQIYRRTNDSTFATIIDLAKTKTALREWHTYGVFQDSQGRVWTAVQPNCYASFTIDNDGRPRDWRVFGPESDVEIKGPYPVFSELDDGTIVVASRGHGSPPHLFDGISWHHQDLTSIGGVNYIRTTLKSSDGTLWLGGLGGRLHLLRHGKWAVYTNPDVPMERRRIVGLVEMGDGSIWFAFRKGNVLRLDYGDTRWLSYNHLSHRGTDKLGRECFVDSSRRVLIQNMGSRHMLSHGREDGLLNDANRLHVTQDGSIWVIGSHQGDAATARLTDNEWILETHPEFAHSTGHALGETRDGAIWVPGPTNLEPSEQGGILRFDGKDWKHLKAVNFEQSLGFGKIFSDETTKVMPGILPTFYAMSETPDGRIWMGSFLGLYNYRKLQTVRVVEPGFVMRAVVQTLFVDLKGRLWVGTRASGVLVFDGKEWIQYGIADGLIHDNIRRVAEGPDGSIWIGTTKGISRFDGFSWTTQDHLWAQDSDELAWPSFSFSSNGSVYINKVRKQQSEFDQEWISRVYTTRYIAETEPPDTFIQTSDSSFAYASDVLLSWKGMDPWAHTPDRALKYSYRLNSGPWSPYASDRITSLTDLPTGDYEFSVRTRDRDFNIDPTPAVHRFSIAPPVWQQSWFVGLITLFIISLSWQGRRIITRTRERNNARDQLLAEAEAELATAHEMQMGLLPTDDAKIPGYDVASRCRPATHVGGDFIKYAIHDHRSYVAMADVTGHGMEAAIPVVMFSGILDSHLQEDVELPNRLPRLNQSMLRALQPRTFICCCLTEFDLRNSTVRIAIAGFPPIYHYENERNETHEISASAFPLGLRHDASYNVVERIMEPGDYLVICSDGLLEAEDPSGQIIGYEQTAELISSACEKNLSAQGTLDNIVEALDVHRNGAPQTDDVTCVVLRRAYAETIHAT